MSPNSAITVADMGRRAVQSAMPVLLAAPVEAAGRTPDPIHEAIERAQDAREAYATALDVLGVERNKAAVLVASAAADRDTRAREALAALRPTTRDGLHALIRFYAEDAQALDPNSPGSEALQILANGLPEPAPARRRTPSLASRLFTIISECVALAMMTGGSAAVSRLHHLF